ncbi:MAG: heavy metal-binding domain-containing protein [Lutibacter sp.]|uniref:heavy metal-binding domain-containing protein n=1 Tax=Lutibacter sp. TaxID=1925666 RepID=UPI00299D1F28|nr:heavy metal-binding domain-containing protein [Lutibacter sp.]MDX1830346.1 heavy metal-binding domain-containing protein [Lutibacter sp.]
MKKITIALVAIFSVAVITISCNKAAKKESGKEEVKIEKQEMDNHDEMANVVYQCPMDCEHGKTYDKEGNCPVCNMKLRSFKSDDLDNKTSADSTGVSSVMNCKNCKGKMACKSDAMTCKGKMNCKSDMACKGKMNCKSEMAANKKTCAKCNTDKSTCKCQNQANIRAKECAKCNTKNCKGSCKGKA